MLKDPQNVPPQEENPYKNKVHKILAHSYLFYFLSFLLGLILDFFFPLQFFEKLTTVSLGMVFLLFGTLLIFWAQKASLNMKKENLSKDTFYQGPYRYTRMPTHLGLFLLMLGFGFMANAFFIIVLSVVSFFITKFTFLRKEEEILEKKYGVPYLEYKKLVKF